MKKLLIIATLAVLSGCTNDAQVVSRNISNDADNFLINRRIVFYNGMTNDYMLTIEGRCSLEAGDPRKISIICKIADNQYKKSYLGLSDNVTYFIEQLDSAKVSEYRYKVTFKPTTIVPDVTLR